jgi:hypothetical protein
VIDLSAIPGIPRTINIQGVEVSGEALVGLLHSIFRPDPRYWFRFERKGGAIEVTRKLDE